MRTNQELSRLSAERIRAQDWHGYCALFHATESVYIDPFFGELKGQDKIRTWFTSVMSEAGSGSSANARARRVAFDVLFEPTLCGDTVVVESLMKAVDSDGTAAALARFCHVERYRNGWIVYAADYYDTHPLRQLARASQRTGIGPPPG